MASTDPESDMISQAIEIVEDHLEKDSGGKGGVTEQVPLNRGEEEKYSEAVDVKFENGIDGTEDLDEFIEVFIEAIPDLDPTLDSGTLDPTLDSGTLSGTDTARKADDIMSCATDDNYCKTATAEEKVSEKVECEKEFMPAEKCMSKYAESVAGKCISDNLESVAAIDISGFSEPSRSLECASVLSSVANDSTPVSISLGPVNSAAKETTDTDVSSGPLQNNNNDTDRNRFLNVVPLPDGSVEIVLESGAWSSADPDQERYLDLEFPFVDEQAWIGCDILEF